MVESNLPTLIPSDSKNPFLLTMFTYMVYSLLIITVTVIWTLICTVATAAIAELTSINITYFILQLILEIIGTDYHKNAIAHDYV